MTMSTRTVWTVVFLSGASLLPQLASAAAVEPTGELQVALRPGIVRLHERATITVSGLRVPALEARLAGATDAYGKELPWRSLRPFGGAWRGTLPSPALRGVYRVELRTGKRVHSLGAQSLSLRVFNPGTSSRPRFERPIGVVRWWVRAVAHSTLVAVKAWPRPAFDHRDRTLHRLFVVAYSRPGHPAAHDRLGMFITAFRATDRAAWRLLEASVLP